MSMLSDLETDRARLADIEAQILDKECSLSASFDRGTYVVDLERSLSVLRTEKSLVKEWLHSYKYPVLELPNEIISEIFIHFLPIYPACPPLTGLLSPTTLTHICRKWREIALTTPLLWRAIGLSDERRSDICNTWLTRSRCCPLSIHVNEHFDWESMPQILSALISHRSRWEDLKVHFVGRDRPRIEGSMPLLRHLDLEFPSHAIQAATFSEAPLLRAVRLTGTLSVTLPWLQLTSITLCEVDPRQCEPILKQTSNIVHCELHFWISHPLADQPLSNIALPCLESLVLNRYSEPVTGYLAFISVPSLRSLRTPERFLGSDPIGLLASFMSNSGCSLQEVCITGKRAVSINSYRGTFPAIPKFSITGLYVGDVDERDSGVDIDASDVENISD